MDWRREKDLTPDVDWLWTRIGCLIGVRSCQYVSKVPWVGTEMIECSGEGRSRCSGRVESFVGRPRVRTGLPYVSSNGRIESCHLARWWWLKSL